MKDVHLIETAGAQHNRVSYRQLRALGYSRRAIDHRLATGRLVRVREGVFAVAPVLRDNADGYRMELTLTAPGSALCRVTAARAFGVLSLSPPIETIVRRGSGGVQLLDGIRVHRSKTLEGETTTLRGIPITTSERTLLDLAACVSGSALARALRESVRLEQASLDGLGDALGRFRGRRGCAQLASCVARYAGLPLDRARSGAEIRALEVLRGAGRELPALNLTVAGEEADLVWRSSRLIVEIDGGPFHLDRGADERKQARWQAAGWEVRRIPSSDPYERPWRLLDLVPD